MHIAFLYLMRASHNFILVCTMEIDFSYRNQSGPTNLFAPKISNIRISPGKPRDRDRDNLITRKSLKPFSSSIIPDKKKIPTREEIQKTNSKLELIKSKCMKQTNKLKRNESRNTLNSQFMSDQQINDSVDLDSEDGNNQPNNKAHLIKSVFQDRPPTVYFHYPKCCAIQPPEDPRIFSIDKAQLTYKIAGSQYKCIVNSLEFNGFTKAEEGNDWNVFFDISGTHLKSLENMTKYQKFNHYPGCWHLGRKDYMWKNLNKQRRSHPEAYNFVPNTYLFPADFDRLEIARENAGKDKLWIMKPTNQACGRGIKMVTKQTKLKNKSDILVSQYVANPHLINNFKYDLRIYIVVTSYDPLRIYMFEEGLTRFATYQYNTQAKDTSKRFIHLTNFSVNKHSKKFVKNNKSEQDGVGSKWSLTALKKHYDSNGISSQKLFESIKDVIIKTCISAQPVMLDIYSKTQERRACGFELYGFDILVDENLKPWLMEVNVCPSLSSSSPMDRKIKHTLLTDILNLIGIEHYNKKAVQLSKKKDKQRLHMPSPEKKYYSKNINSLEHLHYNNCVDLLSPEDWLVLFESEQELSRAGHFERIFPTKKNAEDYRKLFEFNRYNNNILWKHLKSEVSFINRLYK